jgi:hypothetical protein
MNAACHSLTIVISQTVIILMLQQERKTDHDDDTFSPMSDRISHVNDATTTNL